MTDLSPNSRGKKLFVAYERDVMDLNYQLQQLDELKHLLLEFLTSNRLYRFDINTEIIVDNIPHYEDVRARFNELMENDRCVWKYEEVVHTNKIQFVSM